MRHRRQPKKQLRSTDSLLHSDLDYNHPLVLSFAGLIQHLENTLVERGVRWGEPLSAQCSGTRRRNLGVSACVLEIDSEENPNRIHVCPMAQPNSQIYWPIHPSRSNRVGRYIFCAIRNLRTSSHISRVWPT
jgi:hypothetical protein